MRNEISYPINMVNNKKILIQRANVSCMTVKTDNLVKTSRKLFFTVFYVTV